MLPRGGATSSDHVLRPRPSPKGHLCSVLVLTSSGSPVPCWAGRGRWQGPEPTGSLGLPGALSARGAVAPPPVQLRRLPLSVRRWPAGGWALSPFLPECHSPPPRHLHTLVPGSPGAAPVLAPPGSCPVWQTDVWPGGDWVGRGRTQRPRLLLSPAGLRGAGMCPPDPDPLAEGKGPRSSRTAGHFPVRGPRPCPCSAAPVLAPTDGPA